MTAARREARAGSARRSSAGRSNAAGSLKVTDERGLAWRGAGLRCRTDRDLFILTWKDFRERRCDPRWAAWHESTRSLASIGIAMEACDAQEFGVAFGGRRQTALPGRHGASGMDQVTVRSALNRNIEAVGGMDHKVRGTRRNANP